MLFSEGAIQQPCYYGKISAFIVGGNDDTVLVVLRRHRCFRLQSVLPIVTGVMRFQILNYHSTTLVIMHFIF